MSKFIIVDSNITGTGGHYLEYALQLFEIAHQEGHENHLIPNIAFRPTAADIFKSHPTFDFDMWGACPAVDNDPENEFTETDLNYLRKHYSASGLLWAATHHMGPVQQYAAEAPLPLPAARALDRFARLRPLANANLPLEAALRRRKAPPRSQADDRRIRYLAMAESIRTAATGAARPPPTADSTRLLVSAIGPERYGAGLQSALRAISIDEDDHVFIPTLSLGEASAVRDLLNRNGEMRKASWSLLFRRDAYRGHSNEWEAQEWRVHAWRNFFLSLVPLTSHMRLQFFTDTDPLTAQYNRFSGPVFRTTGVPARPLPPQSEEAAAPRASTIEISFLRDGRTDHGREYLATLLNGLSDDILSSVRVFAWEVACATLPDAAEIAPLRPYTTDVLEVMPPCDEVGETEWDASIVVLIEPSWRRHQHHRHRSRPRAAEVDCGASNGQQGDNPALRVAKS
jgi:hypothetical protein